MITAEERKIRRGFIGSSDAAAVLGLDPMKTAADVYLSKVFELDEPEKPSDAIIIGNALEGAILDWCGNEVGKRIMRNVSITHQNGIMRANLDGFGEKEDFIVECKTAGIVNKFADLEDWGEVGTDQVPERVFVQVHHQFACCAHADIKTAYVPALLGGVGLRLYRIERDDELIKMIEAREVQFWNDFVLKNIKPDDAPPSMDIVKRIRRTPNKTVPIEAYLISEWKTAKSFLTEAKEREEAAKARIIAALGDAEAGESELGDVTYFETTRKAYQVKETSFRVLRPKAEGGKKSGKSA